MLKKTIILKFWRKQFSFWISVMYFSFFSFISFAQVNIENDLIYATASGKNDEAFELKLDSYSTPKHSSHKRPVLLLVHGGGFAGGDKRQALYIKIANIYAQKGYVVFSINYRLKGKKEPFTRAILNNAVSDVNSAIKWILSNQKKYSINKRRIIICGDSAGGGIVVNTAFQNNSPIKFAACINLWGGLPENELWNAPIDKFINVENKDIPVCIIHGTKDSVIPLKTSSDFFKKIRKNNTKSEFHSLLNADHYPEERADDFLGIMISFSDKILNKSLVK